MDEDLIQDQTAMLRVPPHSIESEQAVLGSLLLDNVSWERVADLLVEDDFYRYEHRQVFAAIAGLVNSSRPADVITVFEQLRASGCDQEVGLQELNALAQCVPNAANARRYAEIVREKAILRNLVTACDSICVEAFGPQARPVSDTLDDAERRIMAIGETSARARQQARDISEVALAVMDRVQELADRGSEVTGVPTGFVDIDRMTAGMQPGDLIVVAARPSMGKALSLESLLLTPSGWIRMGDIKVGDMVIGRDGMPYPVLGVYPQGDKQMYRVAFDDGASVVCCDEHLWFTSSRADRKAGRDGKVRPLSEIRKTLRAGGCEQRLSHQIPWVEPMDLGANDLPLDPYLLGLFLGDGSSSDSSIRFHNPELDLVDKFSSLLPAGDELWGLGKEWRVKRRQRNNQPSETSEKIEALGLLGKTAVDKFVPPQYLWTTAANRLALLRGLVDTDGFCHGTGIEYATASPQLAEAIVFLVRSLGGRVTRKVRATKFHHNGERRSGLPSHRLHFSFDSDLVPASSNKHLKVYRGVSRRTGRYISDVTPAGVMPAQCITVAAPDGLFVTDDFIVTHNTAFALNIAENVALKEGLPVIAFSMEMSADQLGIRLIGSIGRINQQNLRTGRLTDGEWGRFSEAVEKLRDIRISIDETAGMNITELRAKARRLARRLGKVGLVVVDYLQLMEMPSGSDENRATGLGEISRGLKALAKELGCPVIALSQLNRAVEQRTDKRPVMSDIRESGAIEQDADTIMMLYRDDYYFRDSKEPGVAEVIIAKQRNGPTGTVKMAFVKTITKFESLATDWQGGA